MTWGEALAPFVKKHFKKLSTKEIEILYEYPWNGYCIGGLWSHRGVIWKKYEGTYPNPEDVGLEPDHPFFDPEVVTISRTMNGNGECIAIDQFWRGRRLKPSHRLYQRHPR